MDTDQGNEAEASTKKLDYVCAKPSFLHRRSKCVEFCVFAESHDVVVEI